MSLAKKVATGALIGILSLANAAKAGVVFNPLFDDTNPHVTIEGRMSFDDGAEYSGFMRDGEDEVGLFLDDGTCIGSTDQVSALSTGHYDGLKMNSYFFNKFASGRWDVSTDLFAKVYNSDTGTFWDADIMDNSFDDYFYGRDHHIDVQANEDTGVVPESATLALLGVGALALRKRKKG